MRQSPGSRATAELRATGDRRPPSLGGVAVVGLWRAQRGACVTQGGVGSHALRRNAKVSPANPSSGSPRRHARPGSCLGALRSAYSDLSGLPRPLSQGDPPERFGHSWAGSTPLPLTHTSPGREPGDCRNKGHAATGGKAGFDASPLDNRESPPCGSQPAHRPESD